MNFELYYKYSDFLKKEYGEKVYKLPINLPITCPNRISSTGCSFCAKEGTGFEALQNDVPVIEQLSQTQKLIAKKYHAYKYIAYFQNYTNTFMPLDIFLQHMNAAANFDGVVQISVATRPDCIRKDYLDVLKKVSQEGNVNIHIELGLQTVNYHTLAQLNRGHSLAEYINAVKRIQEYGFSIGTHLILNLPGDSILDVIETSKIVSALEVDVVKLHSLYIAKNTLLCDAYEDGKISICSKTDYFERVVTFLEYLDPQIAVERLFSRIPEKDAVFSNWGISWWKLMDQLKEKMHAENRYQGQLFHYLDGSAFKKL